MTRLAVTWWGHSSTTVELSGVRVATDPVLVDRFGHLVRRTPSPSPTATDADVVLVSHLHADHLHGPSTARFDASVPFVVPRDGGRYVRGDRPVHEVSPGDRIELAGLHVEVFAAHHPGTRTDWSRRPSEALGFRVHRDDLSFWFGGDTGPSSTFDTIDPVDLALVPIGGWGPTLGEHHLDPEQAAEAVDQVGARWAVPVHYGTFWPFGLRLVAPANHRRLFVTPPARFVAAMAGRAPEAVVPRHGERVVLA